MTGVPGRISRRGAFGAPGKKGSGSAAGQECRRCGTCCMKDGPVLHPQDRALVESGRIPLRVLVTVRKGEAVRDPRDNRLIWAESEMIKIKGIGKRWTCSLFDPDRKRCTGYENRPAECRVMACWDTAEIEKLMTGPFLGRADLLTGQLRELVREHENGCDCSRIRKLAEGVRAARADAAEELERVVCFDRAFRELAAQRGGIPPEHLDFLLGRPLSLILPGFGIRIGRQPAEKGLYR